MDVKHRYCGACYEFENAGFTRQELYGNVAGAPFSESASEFAIVGKGQGPP